MRFRIWWIRHVEHWIYIHICPNEYEHSRHLVDDVISLELKLQQPFSLSIKSESQSQTLWSSDDE